MSRRINLDSASSTPLLPEVRAAIAAVLEETGNPSSIHTPGQRAKEALEQARRQVAALLNAKPAEIHFTSCGTEANNWALRGLCAANKRKGSHIVISAIEHPSVSLVARRLEMDSGACVTVLPVDREGFVSPAELKAALKPETVLVSIMLANGEVGTIQPIQELAALAHEQGALFHTDAVAAVGHVPVDVKSLGVDALSLAANQFYGPPGAAALFVRDGVRILPLLEGGGQEQGGRSGTEALPAIVGMGVAAELAAQRLGGTGAASGPHASRHAALPSATTPAAWCPPRSQDPSHLRDRLRDGLIARIEHLRINGPVDFRRVARSGVPTCPQPTTPIVRRGEDSVGCEATGPAESQGRLPHNLHVCVEGVSSESLVLGLDEAGIAAGLGSACNSKAMRPSHVLKAMGLTDEQAKGAVVFTVGIQTTEEEITRALEVIPQVVQRLRNVTALTAR